MTLAADSIYQFHAQTIDGQEISLEKYRGRVLLIVNVASHCGFTPQYRGLQELHEKYSEQGLSVLGFPCNQFGGQEPGNNQEIREFCSLKYKVTFDMFAKVDVNGDSAHPLYRYLKDRSPGILGLKGIKWNFTKFLVDRNGRILKRFFTMTTPAQLEKAVVQALASTV